MSLSLGRKIKAMRRLKCVTQQELAQSIGISVSQLSGIERGRKYPKSELILKIAETLKVSPYEFFMIPDNIKKYAIV